MIGLIRYGMLYARTAMRSERGATMVEYALMVALIALVALGAVQLLGEGVESTFDRISDELGGVDGNGNGNGT